MRKSIPISLKKIIADRAKFKCEYCLISEKLSFYNFQIEHIISIKHGGTNDLENLAYCCPECNYQKGSDIGTIVNGNLTPFFNPRNDIWEAHFKILDGEIVGITKIGTGTTKILKFNQIYRLIFRKQLISFDLFP